MRLGLKDLDMACVALLPRAILGFVYFFAGIHKLTDVGLMAFAHGMAASDGGRFLPAALLTAVGTVVPFMEIALGALLLVGLWTRSTLYVMAVLICVIAGGYGISGLLHPIGATAMDITVVNGFILPRAALIIAALFVPSHHDWFSIDGLMRFRHS